MIMIMMNLILMIMTNQKSTSIESIQCAQWILIFNSIETISKTIIFVSALALMARNKEQFPLTHGILESMVK